MHGFAKQLPESLPASWHDPDEWRWFALRIAPGREFIAERILRDDGFDVFAPLCASDEVITNVDFSRTK
jgi:hypothetical protein